ncbi:hypothetical protein DFA_05498 [Cavenderia fasciculata]|uniref:SMP-LTD domain-containing protein n=1 Tax=Cavenderia fasciculata TaxID=261658 RepID=F4PLE4_CACFS|nr:uncharacterized protein DFA_05498 [Cavenderia fasciculata]EGG23366.1 hypothetical protein DFA_05498 [Cavenderia fasciculata]|eukprot:XP_004361217.1 hypothetical protein DFA_05498 [Cavenderia fasciculata]
MAFFDMCLIVIYNATSRDPIDQKGVVYALLSKKIDPRSLPKDKSLKQQQQQLQHQQQQHNNKQQRTHKKSFYFTSSTNEPIDYSISNTPPTSIETCKWINFITKRVLSEINHSQQYSRHIHELLNSIAEDESKPDYIGKLSFSDINIGTTTPEIGTIRLVSPVNASVNVIEFDLIYSGDASITASTELWLNWPQKHTACLPVKTKISIKQFSGNFVLYLPNHTNPLCSLYLKESPSLTLRMVTKMGHETVLKEPGKIGQFIQNFIVKTLNSKVVNPNRISFPLFNFLHPAVSNSALSLTSSIIHPKEQQQSNSTSSNNNTTSSSTLQPNSTSSTPLSLSSPVTGSIKQSVSNGSIVSLAGLNGSNSAVAAGSSMILPSQKKGIKHRKPHHHSGGGVPTSGGSTNGGSASSTPSLSSSNGTIAHSSGLSSSSSISAPASTQTSPTSSPAIGNHITSSSSLTTPLNLPPSTNI